MAQLAVITGASRGIGEALSRRLAAKGMSLALISRESQKLRSLEKELGSMTRCRAFPCDFAENFSAEELFSRIEKALGAPNYVVNNAADLVMKPLVETMETELTRLFRINVTAPYLLTQAFFASVARSKPAPAAIVNVASVAGVQDFEKFPGLSAYSASKAAVIALSQSSALEGASLGIRVNALCPGAVDTEMLQKAAPQITERLTPARVAEEIEKLMRTDQTGQIQILVPE